ncbi:class I adenylate-forming enzyme family protein [Streptomyces sp. TLI_171]|uniref:class I adenylate-forming enzyme family protein n=1 Tax=Streptomyces sp. TLI_171 TaxID=1938859 RepID=UPI000C1A01A3|nr:class I adenylate-forming enzyme family protein [Streptomyces sp. TLI_171]RKE20366.1 acyl-CoA synthetase (AMP-forming)/AMP-acid ligase II [Streptomyces sp. TLI_171]
MLDQLARTLREGGSRPALLGSTRSGSARVLARCADLADLADRYAAVLHHRHGLRPGDTLGVAVRPGPRALAVLLAAHRLGLRTAVLDPSAGPDVLRARLALAPPALVLADAAAQAVAGWARPLARRAHLELPPLHTLGPVATVGRRHPGCARALGEHPGPPPPPYEGDGDAVIVFTSGTTSAPRGVVHTRASLTAGMRAVDSLVRPRPGGTVLGGTTFVLVPALAAGATVALPARRSRLLQRQIDRLAPDETYLTPPRLRPLTRLTGRVWTGSAPADAALLRRAREAGATEAWGVYALTELFPAAAVEEREKSAHRGPGDLLGHPLPGVRTRLGADGELLLSAPSARDRYLGEDPDPWVRTGDRAELAPDGRIVLAGRLKDMVLRRAENIYPGLYEPSLHLPEVELAVLVGVPAPDGDERLVALVQPRAGADHHRLRTALRDPLARMGAARPDALLLGPVPLAGRSRKPDRAAAARYCAHLLADTGTGSAR